MRERTLLIAAYGIWVLVGLALIAISLATTYRLVGAGAGLLAVSLAGLINQGVQREGEPSFPSPGDNPRQRKS